MGLEVEPKNRDHITSPVGLFQLSQIGLILLTITVFATCNCNHEGLILLTITVFATCNCNHEVVMFDGNAFIWFTIAFGLILTTLLLVTDVFEPEIINQIPYRLIKVIFTALWGVMFFISMAVAAANAEKARKIGRYDPHDDFDDLDALDGRSAHDFATNEMATLGVTCFFCLILSVLYFAECSIHVRRYMSEDPAEGPQDPSIVHVYQRPMNQAPTAGAEEFSDANN